MNGWLEIKPLQANNGNSLKEQIASLTQWQAESEVYSYQESLSSCCLELTSWQSVTFSDELWEGRIFDQNCEIRWIKHPELGFKAWLNRETESDLSGAIPVKWQDRRYYLHGEYAKEPSTAGVYQFNEGRFPHKDFAYPLKTPPKEHDRAYIHVREYLRSEPDWSVLSDAEIQEQLDAPLLIGHRFMSIQAGQDEGR